MAERHWIYGVTAPEMHERFWREYESKGWEAATRRFVERILKPGDLFVDVGAWIGPVTLWALEQGARVVAVEPDPVALVELTRRVPEEVEIWEGAVAREAGTAWLKPNFGLELGKSVSRLSAEGEVRVRTWTLQEVLGERVPALVKVDVEGYEKELLPAIAPFLAGLGVPLQAELHGVSAEAEWFDGYDNVQMPDDLEGAVRAWP